MHESRHQLAFGYVPPVIIFERHEFLKVTGVHVEGSHILVVPNIAHTENVPHGIDW